MMRIPQLIALTLMLLTAVGCNQNPTTYPVRGRVVYPDGKPVTGGTLEFETIGQKPTVTATAEIATDGQFTMGTYSADDGALPGKHRAAVIADFEIGTQEERPGIVPPETVHRKFREFKTSGLEFDVIEDVNNLEVIVDYAENKK